MVALKRFGLAAAMLAVLSGCASTHSIRLDPLAEDAAVYVNGELRGQGQVTHEVPSKGGFPEEFTVKVEPASGVPYTVDVERELNTPMAIATAAVYAGMGLYFTIDSLAMRQTPFIGPLLIIYSPFMWMINHQYHDYYDLPKLKAAQEPAR